MTGAQPMPEMPRASSGGTRSLRDPRMGIMMPTKARTGSTCPRLKAPMMTVSAFLLRAAQMPRGTPKMIAPMVAPSA